MRAATISEWQVTRASGERVVFECETQREAELLARESFTEDGAFHTLRLSSVCAKCRATVPVGGRCEACGARREARKRTFLVKVSFLVKAGWTAAYEARVKAFSVVGASAGRA